MKVVTLHRYVGLKACKKSLQRFMALVLLMITAWGQVHAQNSFNSGDGWGAGWGIGSSFSSSAGSSLIYTTTNSLGGNINRYFRFFGNGTPCGQYGPSGSFDVSLNTETAYNSSTITCGSAKAFYVTVPNTTDNWVFKSAGVSSQQIVIFRVQGAVRTLSSTSQSPLTSAVRPGQPVTVSTTLSGSQSTGQNVYIRYTTDNFTSSTVAAMTISGTTASATIPAFAQGVNVKYYVFTSGTTTPTHSDADFRTINLDNNAGSNFSYTVTAPAQYTWNQTGSAAYSTATNWTPNRTTSIVSDILIFNNGANTTVTGVPTEAVGSLQISANTTVNLQPTATNTLTINDYVTGSDLTVAQGSVLNLSSGLTLALPTGAAGTINGTLRNAGTVITNTNLTFSSTGTYEHNYTNTAGTIPTATWSSGSTCAVIGYTSGMSFSGSSFSQTFSNFTWNCPNQTGEAQLNGLLTTVNGTLNIISTGIGANNLILGTSSTNFTVNYGTVIISDSLVIAGSGTSGSSSTGVAIVNITGDLTLSGSGLLDFNTLAAAATSTVNLSGNLAMTGTSSIRRSSEATSTLNFIKSSGIQTLSIAAGCSLSGPLSYNIGNGSSTTNTLQLLSDLTFAANANNVTVLSGSSLDLQQYVISGGSGAFAANTGSTLKIGHASGITASAASGAVQLTSRTYNTGVNYVYNGSSDQFTGDGLPATVNTLTIANSGSSNKTVIITNAGTLSISAASSGALTLTSGLLKLQANTDTIAIANNGGITATSGDFSTSSLGTVKFQGTGTVTGTVNFYPAVLQAPTSVAGLTYSSGTTIQNSLMLRVNSFIAAGNAPNYATNSTLIYNIGTSYGRSTEWSATSGRGYPFNVTIRGNTTLDIVNTVNSYKKIAGTLTVESGSTMNMQTLTTGNGSGIGFEILGDVVNDGTISLNAVSGSTTQRLKCVNFTNGSSNSTATTTLSSAVGGDLEVTGNLTDNANFTSNNRALFFTGTGVQTIGGTASGTFNVDYIVSNKTSGSVKILKDLLTEGPNGGNAITLTNSTDLFDLNGFVLTVGKASVNSTISGLGKFRGGSGSGMVINGTGSIGTISFDVTTPGTTNLLSSFTMNRTSNGDVTLGTDLTVGTALSFTGGVVNTGSNKMIINAGATVTRTSGHVNGNLQKTVADGVNNFELGSATVYAPTTITLNGVSGSVILTAKATNGNPTSGSNINQSKKCNHFWTITKTGAGTFTSYTAAFDFTNTTNTGATSSYVVNKYDGSWATVSSSVSGNIISATGLTSFSDFEIGELYNPTVTTLAASSITNTGATLNGTVNANGFSSITSFDYGTTTAYGSTVAAAQSPVTGTSATTVSAAVSSLSVNTQYNFRVTATNSYGTTNGSNLTFYTLASVPGTPTVNNATITSLDVTLDANGNPSNTEFAIQETSTGNYVQSDGTLGASAVWQTASVWGTKTVSGLTGGTSYTFKVKARNAENIETSFSSTASGTTIAEINCIISASASSNSPICIGNNIQLNGSSTGGYGIVSYSWSGPNSFTSSAQNPSINNSSILNDGVYSLTVTDSAGCTSSQSTVVTINQSSSSSTPASVCSNQLPYSWNGNTYNSAGAYSVTLTNAVGCDSVATLVLTVNNTTSSSTSETVCANQLPYSWNGNSYNAAGTYSVTLTNTVGCDSVATLVLTVNNTSSSSTPETVCANQLPYSWNGNSYNAAGTYSVTLTNSVGCDSIASLVLIVNSVVTTDTSVSSCVSYSLNGSLYTSSGNYNQYFTAANGCDSIVQLHLTINPLPSNPGSISGVTEVCTLIGSSTPTTYSITAVAGAASYNWIVPTGATIVSGQGTNSIGVTFVNTLAATNQKISVYTVSGSGCQSAATSSITLTKTVPGMPTISGPSNPCPFVGAGVAVYTCDSITSASSYLWTVPNGASIVSGQGSRSIQVAFTSSFTIGSIGVTAMSNCGNRSQRTYALTRLLPGAPVAISGPTSACSYLGNSQQATYSIAPVANATSYTWTVPANVTIVSGQGTTSIVVTFGASYVTSNFKVKSVSNCSSSSDRQLSVTAATYAAPGAISGPTNACFYINSDATATYKIRKVANAPDYIWTVPAGVTIVSHPGGTGANDTSIAVTFNNNFVFGTRILVQTTGCGTSSATGLTITGTIVGVPNVITGPTNVCQFMVSSSNPNGNMATYTIRKVTGANFYTWTVPSNATIINHPGGTGINDTIVQVKFADVFVSGTLSVKAGNSCGSSANRNLTISRLNVATPSDIDIQMLSDCPSRVYKYTIASVPLQATTVIWTVPEGATIVSGQGTTSITVSYPTGIVSGFVTVRGINNCSNGSIRSIVIKLQSCPGSFTSVLSSGRAAASQQEEMKLFVYPNPSTTSFNVNLKTIVNETVLIRVMDLQGRTVKSYKFNSSQNMSLGHDLKPGSYILEVRQGESVRTTRLVKY